MDNIRAKQDIHFNNIYKCLP